MQIEKIELTRICKICHIEKPIEKFKKTDTYWRERVCAKCSRKRSILSIRRSQEKWLSKNPNYSKKSFKEKVQNMVDHMTAAEFQKEFVLKGAMPDHEFQTRFGSVHFEGRKKIKETNSEWEPLKLKKERKHEEDDLTIQVTDYCELLLVQGKILCFSHIPQETYTKSWVTKKKNTAMGVRAGVPDFLIVFPSNVLFLELKRFKGGVISESQEQWLANLKKTGKVYATEARGWDQSKQIIDEMLLRE